MEGPRFVADFLEKGTPEWVLVAEDSENLARSVALKAAERGVPLLELPPKLFSDLSDTENSQGLIAVCDLPSVSFDTLPLQGVFLLLDGISDPGNMGTIIRSAAAFGCTAVIVGRGSCCPFTPKVTRSAAGLNSVLPIVFDVDLADLMKNYSQSIFFLGADASGGNIEQIPAEKDCLGLVIGSEAHGISEEAGRYINATVSIPMTGEVESLNAAVSASILLYVLAGYDS